MERRWVLAEQYGDGVFGLSALQANISGLRARRLELRLSLCHVGKRRAALRVQGLVISRRPLARPDNVAIGAVDSDSVVAGRQIHDARRHDWSGLRWLFIGKRVCADLRQSRNALGSDLF